MNRVTLETKPELSDAPPRRLKIRKCPIRRRWRWDVREDVVDTGKTRLVATGSADSFERALAVGTGFIAYDAMRKQWLRG